jgi:tetratricopeptide (TPR) repeat protein
MDSLAGDQTLERFGLAVLPAVHSRAYLARTLAEQGVFEEADAHGLEAMRIAQTLDHPFSVLWACLGQAYVDSTRGAAGEAARLLERGLALCHQWNITTYVPVTMAPLGHAYARSGRIGEGISLLQQALALYESAGIGFFHSISVAHLGEAYLLADRVEDARGCAGRSETLARTRGERGYEVYAWRLLGEVATLAVPPRVAEAEVWYGQALASAEDLGMRPLAAHCHFGLGTLYQRTGQQQEAQRHLTTATAMYREMRMAFWLEQAETKMSMLT